MSSRELIKCCAENKENVLSKTFKMYFRVQLKYLSENFKNVLQKTSKELQNVFSENNPNVLQRAFKMSFRELPYSLCILFTDDFYTPWFNTDSPNTGMGDKEKIKTLTGKV